MTRLDVEVRSEMLRASARLAGWALDIALDSRDRFTIHLTGKEPT